MSDRGEEGVTWLEAHSEEVVGVRGEMEEEDLAG